MKQSVRSRLQVERLESRDVPSSATQTFDATPQSALPSGWTQWSNDGSTVFASASGQTVSSSVVSSGGSRTSGLAWQTQTESGDTGVSAQVQLNTLIPTFVFARGANLGTATPSYIAAVVTRGATVSVMQVTNGTSTLLGTVASPSSAYFSGNWVNVSLVPNGSSVAVQVMREDTGQYLNAQGTWQSAATNAIVVNTTLADASGDVGIGRVAAYSGSVDLSNFTVNVLSPPPTPSPPPPPPTTGPTVNESFDTTAIGATPTGWQSWVSNSAGTAGVSSALAFSQPNGYALTGASNTAERAWSTAALPAAVSASVAVDLNSLIPAQLYVDGANLNTTTPTYDAVILTRGVQASLVQVVNGTTTTLATLSSASSGYLSGQWVQVELTAQGTDLLATIYRTDTDQWLTSSGTWSATPTYAFNVQNADNLAAGAAGIGRMAGYAGTLNFDNFTAGAIGTVGPAVTVTSSVGSGSVSGAVTFQATATGNVSQVVFILNGQVQMTSQTSSASWTFNTNALANGSYTLTVLASGTDGTVGAGTYSFTVANASSPPSPPAATDPQQVAINSNPASAMGYSPAPSTDTLFGPNGPSYLDVEQGQEGDCWLIASLAEVAAQAPQDIRNMFTYDGTTVENGATVGVYTVRFFNSNNVAKYVTVDTELPNGGSYYDQPTNGVLWVALAEKAYAIANGLGYVSTSDPGSSSYDALNSGYSYWALQAITGKAASTTNINPSQIAATWNAGNFVVLSTISPASSLIVGDHDYAVVGYNASSGLFELMNPWGGTTSSNLCPQDSQVYGLFSANAAFISANFSMQYIGVGVANQGSNSLQLAEPGGSNSSGWVPTVFEGHQARDQISASFTASNGFTTSQHQQLRDVVLGSLNKSSESDNDFTWSSGGFVG